MGQWVHFSRRLLWSAADHGLELAGEALGGGAPECHCGAAAGGGGQQGGGGPWAGAASGAFHRHQRRVMLEESAPMSAGLTAGYIVICIFLVIFSGMMAGLTLGLLSLDKMDLEVIKRSGTTKDKWLVSKIEPLVAHTHYLLATLLLCNAAAMETLPIFLDRLLNPVAAIIISVTAILIFGEILPQAVCKRYGLQVGAYLSYFVRFLMLVTGVITWPIGKLLDWMLGEESALFRRQEIKALVTLHAEPQDDGSVSALTADEVQVIQGALDMATKTAQAAMTPIEKVFMVSSEAVINKDLLHKVIQAGHSRLPVYDGRDTSHILGLILVKELVLVDEMAGIKVKDLRVRELPFLRADIPMYDVMKIFRLGRSHMAALTHVTTKLERDMALNATGPLVSTAVGPVAAGAGPEEGGSTHGVGIPRRGSGTALSLLRFFKPSPSAAAAMTPVEEVVGIITIEDVLEELLQQEIIDETDQYVDNMQTVKPSTLVSLQHLPPSLRKFLTRSISAGGSPHLRVIGAGGSGSGPAIFITGASTAANGGSAPPGGATVVVSTQQLQQQQAASAASAPALPRTASAGSIGAAAAAGAVSAAGASGAGAAPVGATVGALAAGAISATQGNHPIPPGTGGGARPPLPPPPAIVGRRAATPPSLPPVTEREDSGDSSPGTDSSLLR